MKLTDATFPELPRAACIDVPDPDLFFTEEPRRVEQCRQICRRCPEIRPCLVWAITYNEHGVWAATTPAQRQQLVAHHRRNRT
ncbi:MAG: WhiB family transcriptional regulator [Nocardioides sp.]